MAKAQTRLTIVPAQWCAAAADILENARGCATVDDLKAQVLCGASLFRVLADNGDTVGFYILRIDQDMQGHEGVLVAAAGRAGVDLTAAIVPVAIGQCQGCYSFRIHTARAGMAKKLALMGFNGAEVVMRKKIE